MNSQYLEYIPEVGIPAANSHHGQQHLLHKPPECKAANLSNFHDAETCSSWADHVGGLLGAFIPLLTFQAPTCATARGVVNAQPKIRMRVTLLGVTGHDGSESLVKFAGKCTTSTPHN